MFTINSAITYVAVLMAVAGGLPALEKYTKWKVFKVIPPLVWMYIILMALCTLGIFNDPKGVCEQTYSSLKNNILYAMIFVMLLKCDFKKLFKLTGKLIAVFLAGSLTIGIGFLIGYPIFKGFLGSDTVGATAALYASWVGGSPNMAAMQEALKIEGGAYACALAVDTVWYSLWIAFLLLAVRFAPKWNRATKSDTSDLQAIADAANKEVEKGSKKATATDWLLLLGLSLSVSAFSQWIGEVLEKGFGNIGLAMFDKGTCTTLFVTILGIVCAITPLGNLPAIEELSDVYLYAVVALLASTASLTELISAPMWIVFGLFILVVHSLLMFLLSRVFHWDLFLVSTSSLANVGGSASAPIVACAYNPSYAGIGVLMGVLGAAVGNFAGLGMNALLKLF